MALTLLVIAVLLGLGALGLSMLLGVIEVRYAAEHHHPRSRGHHDAHRSNTIRTTLRQALDT